MARRTFRTAPDADALYMAGGRLRVLEVTEELEHDLGVPVIASTQATVWQTLNALNLRVPVSGYGRLLAELPPLP